MKDTYLELDSCNTCKRIAGDINLPSSFHRQNVREEPISQEQIEFLYAVTNSYEALFNKRSQEYRKRELNLKQLTESDYKSLLTDHYSFIKRPILFTNDTAYIGNSKKTVAAMAAALDA